MTAAAAAPDAAVLQAAADRFGALADPTEVRKPTLFGELIIALVYLPILTLEGIEGKLFRPMALTVVFALLGSVLLSMTLAPVLASLALRKGAHAEPRFVGWLRRRYAPALSWTLRRPRTVIALALAVLAASALGATRLGSEFIPRLSEGAIVVNVARLAEVSLEESIRMGDRLEKVLLEKFPDEVARVWTRTGTPEVATDPMGVELSDVFGCWGWTPAPTSTSRRRCRPRCDRR